MSETADLNSSPKTPDYSEKAEVFRRNFVRTPLIISLFGLMFSVFYGVGGLLSLISLIMGVKRIKVRKSTSLKWAITISAVTVALCVLYVASLSGALILGILENEQLKETTALLLT